MYWWMVHRDEGWMCKKVWIHVIPLSGVGGRCGAVRLPAGPSFSGWEIGLRGTIDWLVAGCALHGQIRLFHRPQTPVPSLEIGNSPDTRIYTKDPLLTPRSTPEIHSDTIIHHWEPLLTQVSTPKIHLWDLNPLLTSASTFDINTFGTDIDSIDAVFKHATCELLHGGITHIWRAKVDQLDHQLDTDGRNWMHLTMKKVTMAMTLWWRNKGQVGGGSKDLWRNPAAVTTLTLCICAGIPCLEQCMCTFWQSSMAE